MSSLKCFDASCKELSQY